MVEDLIPLRAGRDWFSDRRAIPPFASIRAFEAFGRHGGVRRAALELAVHHSVVSRHLYTLEAWLGSPVFERTPSGPRLNETGRHYHKIISSALTMVAEATSEVVRRDESKRLFIWCVPGFASRWLLPVVEEFALEYPSIEVELRPTDKPANLYAEEAHIDIRFHRDTSELATPSGEAWFNLARPKMFPVTSAGWLAANMRSSFRISELVQLKLLHEEVDEAWRSWFNAHGVQVGTRLHGQRLYHAHMALAAAGRGQGIALGNAFLVRDELQNGVLELVRSPEKTCLGVEIGAYVFAYREDSKKLATITKFRDWLGARAARFLAEEAIDLSGRCQARLSRQA